MKYKINKYKTSEVIQNDILIKKESIVLIEVKTHFQKEKEDNYHHNLEYIIQLMFTKLNYFVYLHSQILKKTINEIKIILLYDQNRLVKYKDNIYNYLEKYKSNFKFIGNYEIYFDILYIIPSIGKLSLNHINQKSSETN